MCEPRRGRPTVAGRTCACRRQFSSTTPVATTTVEEEGDRQQPHQTRSPRVRPDPNLVQLAHVTGPLAWRAGGWSSIPNLVLLSKFLNLDYMVDICMLGL